jgi:hypothetical protein
MIGGLFKMTREIEDELLYELNRDNELSVIMLDESNDDALDTLMGYDVETGEYEPDPEPLF